MSALSMSGLGLVSAAHADEVKTDAVATVVADAAVAPDAAAPAAETVAPAEAAKAPTPEKGDIAWMIVATILVTLMVIPGLGLFYGGLVRSKNMLSVLMQTFVVFSLIGVLWAIYGYSVAFTDGSAFIGGLSKAFLAGVTPDSTAATFSKGVVIPEYLYIAFQMTFAAITPALIVGAFAERMKFSAVLLFVILWFTFLLLADCAYGMVLGRSRRLYQCRSSGSR